MNPLAPVMDFLTDKLGPLGPLLAIGFVGFLLILIALPTVMKKQRDRYRELRDQQPGSTSGDEKKRALRRTDSRLDKLERFAQFLEPQKKEELSAAKLKMLRAGYPGKNAVRIAVLPGGN